jgi:CRISPR-associated exonuclease Cas4
VRSEYSFNELLPLSGIQHFYFCRRQWALIHVERQWQENALTAEGRIMHQRADDPFFSEVRSGVIITRSMPVASYRLGLYGVCDVVEFSASPDGVVLFGREGTYLAAPIEYKRGKEKQDKSDAVQVCAQALCLEEMLSVEIPMGYLYYGRTRRRVEIEMSGELRDLVKQLSDEMHADYRRGYTPRVKPRKGCQSCSLVDQCLPDMQSSVIPATQYIQDQISGD